MRVKLISVKKLLEYFKGAFTLEQLKTLRKRYGLFTASIRLGKVTSKGGVGRYVPEESIAYLNKMLSLRREEFSYLKIAKELESDTDKLRELAVLAKRQQRNISETTLTYADKVVKRLKEQAQKHDLVLFKQPLADDYRMIYNRYEKEKDGLYKKDLEDLLIRFARITRAMLKAYEMD